MCSEQYKPQVCVTENDVLVSLSLDVRRRGTPRGKGQVASLHVTSVRGHVLEQQSWKGLHKVVTVSCAYSQLSYKGGNRA